MKNSILALLLCLMFGAIGISAQTHDWITVQTATSGLFHHELDRNFTQLPGGLIQYWTKTTYRREEINQFEVNCAKKERRQLDGNSTSWTPIDESSNGEIAGMVCSMANPKKIKTPKQIAKKGVRIGMTKRQVLASSWGKPLMVNQRITASGTSEQWVYPGNAYLYFDNGRLTSITR